MQKFGRAYKLQIGTANGGLITTQLPFTVNFDITRNTLTSANVCSLRVYNLSKTHQNQLRFNIMDTGDYRPVTFYAGYGTNLPKVFTGSITQASSAREAGSTDFITTIESFDGGYAFNNSEINVSFPAGTSFNTIIKTVAAALPNVAIGSIGNYPGSINRGNTYSGNAADILRDLTGGGFYIDNGKVNCLGDNECVPGQIQVIDSSSGLLGTPVREQTILHFDMIFEPRIVIGQQIQLNSETGANFNGFYKVISVKHRGTISGAVCGDAITTVGLFYGTQALSTVSP